MGQIGSLGTYKAASAIGTGNARIDVAGDKCNRAVATQTPVNYGMVAAAASVTAPFHSVGRNTDAGMVRVDLGMARDTVQLNFLLANWSGSAYSSADGTTMTAVQMYLEKEVKGQSGLVEYQYKYIGTVALTGGANRPAAASKVLNPGAYYVDTITTTEDASLPPGLILSGQAATPANDIASVSFDSEGAIAVLCFPKDATATKFLGVLKSEI